MGAVCGAWLLPMVRGLLVVRRWACHLGGSGLCSKLLLACAAAICGHVHARLGDPCMTRGEFTALFFCGDVQRSKCCPATALPAAVARLPLGKSAVCGAWLLPD